MKKHWWKALGVLIILYTFIAGMLVPLKPGIVGCETPSGLKNAKAGETVTLNVIGYNSHYQQAGDVRAWLKLGDDHTLGAKMVNIESDRKLSTQFEIPAYLPIDKKVQPFTLILDNSIDGASLLPTAIVVSQDSVDAQKGEALWINTEISKLNSLSTVTFPFRNILSETIRNTYFHVPLWFGMFIIFTAGMIMSIQYLRTNEMDYDRKASSLTSVGVLFGILGLITGAIWAKNTWGEYWSFDPKQNMSAILMLIYCAYFVLRNSFEDEEKKARLGAIFNIFAFATIIPLLFVIPRMVDSLHPGSGGNPAFGGEDLDNTMRMVFYPSIIGWTLLGVWMAQLKLRAARIEEKIYEF